MQEAQPEMALSWQWRKGNSGRTLMLVSRFCSHGVGVGDGAQLLYPTREDVKAFAIIFFYSIDPKNDKKAHVECTKAQQEKRIKC